jgi:uncharacterized sulfatase
MLLVVGMVIAETTFIQAATPPNIVMIISDDQGYRDHGFMGHPHIRTPHIDQLARESLTFTRGYVPSSLCRPSLVSILSGQYPHHHGVVGNDPPPPPELASTPRQRLMKNPKYQAVREEYLQHINKAPKLPEILGNAGYLSLQTGKWWEGTYQHGKFTHGMSESDLNKGGRHGDEGLKIGRDSLTPVYKFVKEAKAEQKPFMVWYAPMMPHTPHNPPERLLAHYRSLTPSENMAKYWAMCDWFDETVGDFLNFLEVEKLAENTIVVYVVDNGWVQLTEDEVPDSMTKLHPRGKRSPYDGGLRTPIMFRWPGKITPQLDETHLVSSVDITPTLLSLLQLPADPRMDGIDVANPKILASRNEIFGTVFEHDIVSMSDPAPSAMYRWVIRDNWKLIVPQLSRVPQGKVELYDVLADPDEKQELSTQKPEVVNILQKDLDAWWSIPDNASK